MKINRCYLKNEDIRNCAKNFSAKFRDYLDSITPSSTPLSSLTCNFYRQAGISI